MFVCFNMLLRLLCRPPAVFGSTGVCTFSHRDRSEFIWLHHHHWWAVISMKDGKEYKFLGCVDMIVGLLLLLFLRNSLEQRSKVAVWTQAAFVFIKTAPFLLKSFSLAPFFPIFTCLRRNKAWNDVCRDAITKASIKWFKAFCSIHREPLITDSVSQQPQKSL